MVNNMTYEEFKRMLENEIRKYLPTEYATAEVSFDELRKLGKTYEAFTVRKQGQLSAVALDARRLYDEYLQKPIKGWIMPEIAGMIQEHEEQFFNPGKFTEYDYVRTRLFIRLSNADTNSETLQNVPHRNVEDLAVTYHVMVDGPNPEGLYSYMINNSMMEQLGVNEERLFEEAMQNSPKLFPVQMNDIRDVLLSGGILPQEAGENRMIVMTNQTAVNGAACLLYPGALEEAAKMIGGDFAVLPSSIHEVILLPDNGNIDYDELQQMVAAINQNVVQPEERLSDHVYKYDSVNHQFSIADTSEQVISQSNNHNNQALHIDLC